MSFDRLPLDVQNQILGQLNAGKNTEKLSLDGSVTVRAEINATVEIELEYEDIEVADYVPFLASKRRAKLKSSFAAPEVDEYPEGPFTVLHFVANEREEVPNDSLQEILRDQLSYEIERKLENCVDSTYGVNLVYTEVDDYEIQDWFVENQHVLDEWNEKARDEDWEESV